MAITLSDAAKQALTRIVTTSNADVMLFNAPIERHRDRKMIRMCHRETRRPNLILLLVTEGGDPDAAYRIARTLQNRYERFSCLISGYCKSAGTLLLLGAHELFSRSMARSARLIFSSQKKTTCGSRNRDSRS